MSLEAEVFPLFIGGVALVLLAELGTTLLFLRRRPGARRAMLGHLICVLLAFLCLGILIFSGRRAPDGGPLNGSGLFAMFGIFWCIGEICAVKAILSTNNAK